MKMLIKATTCVLGLLVFAHLNTSDTQQMLRESCTLIHIYGGLQSSCFAVRIQTLRTCNSFVSFSELSSYK